MSTLTDSLRCVARRHAGFWCLRASSAIKMRGTGADHGGVSWRGIAPLLVAAVLGGWLLLGRGGEGALSTDPDPVNQARVAALSSCKQQVHSTNSLICVPDGWKAYESSGDAMTPPALSDKPVVRDGDAFWLEGPSGRLMGVHMPQLPAGLGEQLPTMTPAARASALTAAGPGASYRPLPDGTVPGAFAFSTPRYSNLVSFPAWLVVRGRERFSVLATPINDPRAPIDSATMQAGTAVLASWAWRAPASETATPVPLAPPPSSSS